MKQACRVVVDTSVLVAAVLSKTGASREILYQAMEGSFFWLISKAILSEYRRVLKSKKVVPYAQLSPELWAYLEELFAKSMKSVSKRLKVVRDPTDDMLVECAVEHQADYIISLDQDLLVLKNYASIAILRPKDFLTILKKG